MPILNAIVHCIEKSGDAPARLVPAKGPLPASDALIDYASDQASRGEPITLE